jgi:hypothetical protein
MLAVVRNHVSIIHGLLHIDGFAKLTFLLEPCGKAPMLSIIIPLCISPCHVTLHQKM